MKPRPPYLQTFALFILLAVPAIAGEPVIIKPDPMRSDRYRITDSTGQHIGTVKKDPLDNRRTQILDRAGKPIGYIKPATLPSSTSRYDVYNRNGDKAGTIKRDILLKGRYHFNGKTIKKDPLRQDRWVVE